MTCSPCVSLFVRLFHQRSVFIPSYTAQLTEDDVAAIDEAGKHPPSKQQAQECILKLKNALLTILATLAILFVVLYQFASK